MKKRLLSLLLISIMLLSFAGCSSDDSESESTTKKSTGETDLKFIADGKLTIGVEIGYPPFEDFAEDGTTPIGYDIDFANALGEKLGVEVNFINTAWDGIFEGIDTNYDCVISAVTITEDRKKTMSFSDSYINNYQAVVVSPDFKGEIKSFEDLDGLAIAVQKETTSDILMSEYKDTGSINVTISANEKVTSCFAQLENGEVDAVVVDSTVADGYLAANSGKYVKAWQDDSEPEQFGVALGKDNSKLQTAINKAIAELTEEGFFDNSYKHWFGSEE